MRRGVVRRAVFSLIPLTVVGLLVEGGSRFLFEPPPDREPDLPTGLTTDPEVGWKLEGGFSGTLYEAHRTITRDGGLEIDAQQLSSDQKTILILGDSRTFGNGILNAEDTYTEQLEGLRPEVAVLNGGVPGHTLYQGVQVLKNWPHRFPDVVILAYGFNDRRYVLEHRQTDGPAPFRALHQANRSRDSLAHSRFLTLLSTALQRRPERSAAHRATTDLRGLATRVSPQRYPQLLAEASSVVQSHEAQLFFLLLPDNPTQVAQLNRAERLLREQADLELARESLERAIAADNAFSDVARRLLGSALRERGETQRAAKVLQSPRRLNSASGGYPLLVSRPYVEAVRNSETRGLLEVIDATGALPPETFFDFCHFNEEGHGAVAEILRRALLVP